MFAQNFFLVLGCLLLSSGFILWINDDLTEAKFLGAKHAKRMLLVGIISISIMVIVSLYN